MLVFNRERKVSSYAFIACGAALGWAGSVVVNVGAPTGWMLVLAALCCLVIAYGEQQTRFVGGEM